MWRAALMAIVEHYFEPELQEHVIVISGKDMNGNSLEGDLELMIRTDTISAISLHGIEALVCLLKSVSDWGVVSHKVGGDSYVRPTLRERIEQRLSLQYGVRLNGKWDPVQVGVSGGRKVSFEEWMNEVERELKSNEDTTDSDAT
jgi:hypothetical protein